MLNREILFRAKHDNAGWVIGSYYYGSINNNDVARHHVILAKDSNLYFIDQTESIGEYTGKDDMNDRKIFEGDIAKFRMYDDKPMSWIGSVGYIDQAFFICGNRMDGLKTKEFIVPLGSVFSTNIEVIGNIFDNPELLKGE